MLADAGNGQCWQMLQLLLGMSSAGRCCSCSWVVEGSGMINDGRCCHCWWVSVLTEVSSHGEGINTGRATYGGVEATINTGNTWGRKGGC